MKKINSIFMQSSIIIIGSLMIGLILVFLPKVSLGGALDIIQSDTLLNIKEGTKKHVSCEVILEYKRTFEQLTQTQNANKNNLEAAKRYIDPLVTHLDDLATKIYPSREDMINQCDGKDPSDPRVSAYKNDNTKPKCPNGTTLVVKGKKSKDGYEKAVFGTKNPRMENDRSIKELWSLCSNDPNKIVGTYMTNIECVWEYECVPTKGSSISTNNKKYAMIQDIANKFTTSITRVSGNTFTLSSGPGVPPTKEEFIRTLQIYANQGYRLSVTSSKFGSFIVSPNRAESITIPSRVIQPAPSTQVTGLYNSIKSLFTPTTQPASTQTGNSKTAYTPSTPAPTYQYQAPSANFGFQPAPTINTQ